MSKREQPAVAGRLAVSRARPTLKEIAGIAKVNVSTVSRAINDSPLLPRETKEMILAIADRVNYFPNSLARGLVSQKSETLGIILPKIFFLQGPFFSQVLSGIENVSVEHGYNILIASGAGKMTHKHFPFNLTRARRIDGMLIVNEYQRIANLAALKKEKFPFVLVNRHIADPDVLCVAADNGQGGELATRHLVDLGHRRIAVITGSPNLATTHGRLAGCKRVLAEAGLALDPALVEAGRFESGIETGRAAAARLLTVAPRPTAIFAFSDELAVGAMQAIRSAGLRVPEDVAVVGYDNIDYSAHLSPPLTTVAQSPYDIGATACRMLLDALNGKEIPEPNVLIPVRLVVRDSCGSGGNGERGGRG